jgi:hypothetical protein
VASHRLCSPLADPCDPRGITMVAARSELPVRSWDGAIPARPPWSALFVCLISHQPTVLFSQNKPATGNQPTLLFSQNKPASAISNQPTENDTHI